MTTADIIDKAADLLFIRGRCVGAAVDEHKRLCTIGALTVAAMGDDIMTLDAYAMDEDVRVARRALGRYLGHRGPMAWNDSLLPTPENDAYVIDTLRRCAKELREVETSPAGARRERAVPCSRCGAETWNHSALCNACREP